MHLIQEHEAMEQLTQEQNMDFILPTKNETYEIPVHMPRMARYKLRFTSDTLTDITASKYSAVSDVQQINHIII